MPWLLRFYLWPYYLGRALWRVGAEIYDIVEFQLSRRRIKRRLNRRIPQARALPGKSEAPP